MICEEMVLEVRGLEGKWVVWRLASRPPQIYSWKLIKESWQATTMPPVKLRHSCKSSCSLLLTPNVFIMQQGHLGPLVLHEGSQFCTHEGQGLSLGEITLVTILSSILLENINQRLDEPFGL